MKWLVGSMLNERRSVVYTITLGIWAEVFLYCVLHDLYLIRIAPEHFTVYHPPVWGITDLNLLALAWAFKASIGPGLLLGMAAAFFGRGGERPRMPVGLMLKTVAGMIVVTEIVALLAGGFAWTSGKTLFPEVLYPEPSRPLITTQTIQLTCYSMLIACSTGFIIWITRWRRRAASVS